MSEPSEPSQPGQPGQPAAPSGLGELVVRLNAAIARRFARSLAVLPVSAGDCGGCRAELAAAFGPVHDVQRLGADIVVTPRHADALLVTGPVTAAMREPLLRAHAAMSEPRIVIAAGACAIDGHIFAGAPAVVGPLSALLPVDIFIPGCPPSPRQLIEGLMAAMGRRA